MIELGLAERLVRHLSNLVYTNEGNHMGRADSREIEKLEMQIEQLETQLPDMDPKAASVVRWKIKQMQQQKAQLLNQ